MFTPALSLSSRSLLRRGGLTNKGPSRSSKPVIVVVWCLCHCLVSLCLCLSRVFVTYLCLMSRVFVSRLCLVSNPNPNPKP